MSATNIFGEGFILNSVKINCSKSKYQPG